VEKKAELILIVVGVFMGLAFILMQVKSPMLISVGMYLPIDTSFAIFVGGAMKGLLENIMHKRGIDAKSGEKIGNIGVLLSSGLIAGEALLGVLFAALAYREVRLPEVFGEPSYLLSLACMAAIGLVLIVIPLRNARKSES
jgi:uncharacterized oligopeptide transporter (OPT) family protein